jgi:hypothetical protein
MLNDAVKSSVVSDRELEQEKSPDPSGPRIRCPLCGWSPRKEDRFSPTAGMSGTRSTREASAPCVSTSGLRRNVFRAPAGRRIPIGTRIESGNKRFGSR